MDNAEEVIKLLGTPLGVIAAMLVTVWRVARWLAPLVEEAAKRHFAFMDTCGTSLKDLGTKTDTLNATIIRAEQKIDLMHGRMTATPAGKSGPQPSLAPMAPEPR